MKYAIFPIFNRLIQPDKILGITSISEEGQFTFHNIGFEEDTPFYRYKLENLEDVFNSYQDHQVITYFKKGLFSVGEFEDHWISWRNVNSLLWMYGKDIENEFYDKNRYIYFPLSYYSRLLKSISSKPWFDKLFTIPYPDENVNTLLKAGNNLDGFFVMNNKKHWKFFDPYTKGARFRDTISNSISLEKQKRGGIATKGIKVYVDIDSYHLRLMDKKLGGMIPKDQRGHDWLMEQVFGANVPKKEDQKKLVFTAFYGEQFNLLPCEFTDQLQKKKYLFKSPMLRHGIPFNYVIQEMDVLKMSSFINDLHSEQSKIILYLYDGILFDVQPTYLSEFISKCKQTIDLPFVLETRGKKFRFF